MTGLEPETEQPNISRETKILGDNGSREILTLHSVSLFSAHHKQDW